MPLSPKRRQDLIRQDSFLSSFDLDEQRHLSKVHPTVLAGFEKQFSLPPVPENFEDDLLNLDSETLEILDNFLLVHEALTNRVKARFLEDFTFSDRGISLKQLMPDKENLLSPSGLAFLSDLSSDDRKWDDKKGENRRVRDALITAGEFKLANKLDKCATVLTFAQDSQQKLKLRESWFCRVRQCPICIWRRSRMWYGRFIQVLPKMRSDYPTHQFIFLTLTVKNCQVSELRQTLDYMNKSWRRFSQRKAFPAVGWARSVEITKGEDGSAHPHFHVLMMVQPGYFSGKNYLSQPRWTDLWKSCLRVDYTPIVHVQRVKDKAGRTNSKDFDPVSWAVLETFKYSVKSQDLISDPVWLKQIISQLHNTRAIALGGIFKDYLSEDEPDDLINAGLDDEQASKDALEVRFGWREDLRRYQSM